eukprot:316669-Prymnesium_polylepis.1
MAAMACGNRRDAQVPDAEMCAVVLFLTRCVEAMEVTKEAVHAINVIDSRSCFTEIESSWREENLLALVERNRAALLETIIHLRRGIEAGGGSVRFVWVPAHVGIYSNQMVDA